MNRERWKDWLEAAGFVAIIASLIFVGIETRNSTKQAALTTQALEIAAYQELMDNIAELNSFVVQDAEVAAFLHKALRTDEPLTEVEQFRLDRNLYMRFRHGDIAYFLFEQGAIDDARLQSSLAVLSLESPRVLEFWSRSQFNFVEPYRRYIDRLIERRQSEGLPAE